MAFRSASIRRSHRPLGDTHLPPRPPGGGREGRRREQTARHRPGGCEENSDTTLKMKMVWTITPSSKKTGQEERVSSGGEAGLPGTPDQHNLPSPKSEDAKPRKPDPSEAYSGLWGLETTKEKPHQMQVVHRLLPCLQQACWNRRWQSIPQQESQREVATF